MGVNPIRVATAVLSNRIFAGRPTKDGRGFKDPRFDVTSDVLVAIRDKVGLGYSIKVESEGQPSFYITVTEHELPVPDHAPSPAAVQQGGVA